MEVPYNMRMKGIKKLTKGCPSTGASFQLFLGRAIFFSMPPDYWKIEKKQHFICSNLTLFIVPFFLSFFSLFPFFSFFFFSLGGDGPPAPLKWRPCPSRGVELWRQVGDFGLNYTAGDKIFESRPDWSFQDINWCFEMAYPYQSHSKIPIWHSWRYFPVF